MKLKSVSAVILSLMLLSSCATPTAMSPQVGSNPYDNNRTGDNKTSENDATYSGSDPAPAATAAPTSVPNNTASSGQTGADLSSGVSISPEMPLVSPSAKPEELNQNNFFQNYGVNPFVNTSEDHLSTFSVDVDTASYTWMRKSLENGYLPNKDSVRTEEYINFFNYNYPQPENGIFSINMDMAPSKFGEEGSKLLRVGIQGKEILVENRKDAVLTFVIDVSGSMNMENRLGLVKQSLEILLGQLRQGDKVGIVIYGSDAQVLLEHKSLDAEGDILNAIRNIQPSGSTNAEAGLKLGYQLAEKNFKSGAINRIILCSDGVANVGRTGPDSILEVIKQQSESGISLSTIGFGMGNYNDTLMEQLANDGDGNYYYVDDLDESRRVFVENLTGTLQVIAKDTKVQIDFNPTVVKEYRLLGYENRDIADNDFRNDQVDAGEIGSNHSVTALYEIKLQENAAGKVADTMLRYKDVDNMNTVLEINKSIDLAEMKTDFSAASASFKLAASVAEYAEILKQSLWAKDGKLDDVLITAQEANSSLNAKEVTEFISLVQKAKSLKP